MSDIFAMDGYAAFIWPAYTLTFAAMLALLVTSWRARRRASERVAQLEGERKAGK